ncbi:hypothetical protein OKW50_007788 [Paraburkholderia youngii]|uniref:hypothetical protein n=1 Tax=Paraburkholderia youngii TaxID=2782701 RepID=UPI003D1F8D16
MESFARAVEIVLKESEIMDAPGYCRSQPCGSMPFITAAISSPAMPPDVCSQQPDREAHTALRFPILTFEQWQCGRPPDGGFRIDWLMPGESLVSILWKFACANAMLGDVLLRAMCTDVDPREGVVPLRNAFDLNQLRLLLRLPRNVLRTPLLEMMPRERYYAAFRYC